MYRCSAIISQKKTKNWKHYTIFYIISKLVNCRITFAIVNSPPLHYLARERSASWQIIISCNKKSVGKLSVKPLFSFGFHNWQTDSLIFNIQLPFWFIYLHAIHFIQWQVILYEDKPDWFIPTQSINWNWAILTLLATLTIWQYTKFEFVFMA